MTPQPAFNPPKPDRAQQLGMAPAVAVGSLDFAQHHPSKPRPTGDNEPLARLRMALCQTCIDRIADGGRRYPGVTAQGATG